MGCAVQGWTGRVRLDVVVAEPCGHCRWTSRSANSSGARVRVSTATARRTYAAASSAPRDPSLIVPTLRELLPAASATRASSVLGRRTSGGRACLVSAVRSGSHPCDASQARATPPSSARGALPASTRGAAAFATRRSTRRAPLVDSTLRRLVRSQSSPPASTVPAGELNHRHYDRLRNPLPRRRVDDNPGRGTRAAEPASGSKWLWVEPEQQWVEPE